MGQLEHGLMTVLLLGARVSGLVLFAPFFSHTAIPARVKAGLVILLTVLLASANPPQVAPAGVADGMAAFLSETLVGFLIGLSVMLVFEAAQFAGQVVGMQVGLSLVSLLDPQTQADSPVLSVFLQTLLLLLFLQLNVHHWLVRGMFESVRWLPCGHAFCRGPLVATVLHAASAIWICGMEIAAPVVAATLVADVVVAFLGKASPQMPVLLVGMPVKVVLGLVTLAGALRFWPVLFDRQFAAAIGQGERWLQLAQ